jgi:hypothetical protein
MVGARIIPPSNWPHPAFDLEAQRSVSIESIDIEVQFNSERTCLKAVTIPISVFELSIAYARPALTLWLDRAAIVQWMFDVFTPWNLIEPSFTAITGVRIPLAT